MELVHSREGERIYVCPDAPRCPPIRPWQMLDLRYGLSARRRRLSIASAFREQAGAPDRDVGARATARGGSNGDADDVMIIDPERLSSKQSACGTAVSKRTDPQSGPKADLRQQCTLMAAVQE